MRKLKENDGLFVDEHGKPIRRNAKYTSKRLDNEETRVELLARSDSDF